MIKLHRLNGAEVIINAELIETVEGEKNTVIVLTSGNKFLVKENIDEVISAVIDYKRKIFVK